MPSQSQSQSRKFFLARRFGALLSFRSFAYRLRPLFPIELGNNLGQAGRAMLVLKFSRDGPKFLGRVLPASFHRFSSLFAPTHLSSAILERRQLGRPQSFELLLSFHAASRPESGPAPSPTIVPGLLHGLGGAACVHDSLQLSACHAHISVFQPLRCGIFQVFLRLTPPPHLHSLHRGQQ
ncbi:hypothetical protein L207DRAFT_204854 [Hyaloscypha variabilis F]|jgi:hypothetical protein|uniref:Uncharacterized protein n=1 Tax=Hyaloscypha variabilis (strain UAMH 11265 / GT02V1 / F) TaxID=1149755 RepID=A0A2J6S5J3_HYAVF|nr:hypothetical protein L207DRAFT_204854 [Hyaloscypha variabilis F]